MPWRLCWVREPTMARSASDLGHGSWFYLMDMSSFRWWCHQGPRHLMNMPSRYSAHIHYLISAARVMCYLLTGTSPCMHSRSRAWKGNWQNFFQVESTQLQHTATAGSPHPGPHTATKKLIGRWHLTTRYSFELLTLILLSGCVSHKSTTSCMWAFSNVK